MKQMYNAIKNGAKVQILMGTNRTATQHKKKSTERNNKSSESMYLLFFKNWFSHLTAQFDCVLWLCPCLGQRLLPAMLCIFIVLCAVHVTCRQTGRDQTHDVIRTFVENKIDCLLRCAIKKWNWFWLQQLFNGNAPRLWNSYMRDA